MASVSLVMALRAPFSEAISENGMKSDKRFKNVETFYFYFVAIITHNLSPLFLKYKELLGDHIQSL